MGDNAPAVFGDLNKIICEECGLSMRIHSFQKENLNDNESKIKIKLFCQNEDHTKINELNFKDYQSIVNESSEKICKCILCKNIIQNSNQIPYYCYSCKSIICSDCFKERHTKSHKDVYEYSKLNNKCLIHKENGNDINFYCIKCKKGLCSLCLQNVEHVKKHDVQEIQKLNKNSQIKKKILEIEKENNEDKMKRDELQKKLNDLNDKISFNEFLLKDNNNSFHLFINDNNQINENNINLNDNNNDIINNINDINNKNYLNNMNNNKINDNRAINVIYYDENIKFPGMEIINDCYFIQVNIKSPLILVNEIENLYLLFKYLIKKNCKSKFVLVVNGSSADKVINYIKSNNFNSFFINACIYTSNLNKYESIQKKHSDFIGKICIDTNSLVNFIKDNFLKINVYNEKFNINTLININSYKSEYIYLHKEISKYYANESIHIFNNNLILAEDFIKKQNLKDEEKNSIVNFFLIFSELVNKNYNKIIISYLKDNYCDKVLKSLLSQKNLDINENLGYFIGNLMYCLVQYGKKEKKGIKSKKILYKGMQLNIIELLEFLKNRNCMITFPYFLSMTDKINLAEIFSKRNVPEKARKEKEFYSVIMKISYLYENGYEPSIFDLKGLSQYPDEEDYYLLPFTFLNLNKFTIDSNNYTADIEFLVIGKKDILEYKVKESKTITYDKKQNIMIAK